MLAESKRLEAEINSLRLQISELPEGKLIFSNTGKYTKWYWRNQKDKILIPQKNRPFAEKLATKNYLSALLNKAIHEKQAVDRYLKHHSSSYAQSVQNILNKTEYQRLLSPYFSSSLQSIADWTSAPYKTNPLFPEQLLHKTPSGIYVRSKSEALIATLLYVNKIPFRYECALHLGEITIYPDFTILHPYTQKIYYWEHFGLMDDSSYCKNAYSKLHLYTSNGFIPSHQLITTFETKESPLDSEYITHLITHYFSH